MLTIPTTHPPTTEYAPYYKNYISQVPEQNVLTLLQTQRDQTLAFLKSIPEEKSTILHQPYTWTLKQVLGHINDGERIFSYRALRIARGDATALPGFDENNYAKAKEFTLVRFRDLIDEFDAVRYATIALFRNLSPESWSKMGIANNNPVSVRAVAWILAGHVQHHMNIVRKRLG